MKKYAIVKVNYDNCSIKYKIPKKYKKRCVLNCEECGRCGDTKEQLKMKIATAIKQSLKKSENNNFKAKVLAGIIVEFLGVKE